jgi:hypothetical protein
MMKKKLSLQTLLNLMEYLEKEISITQSFVLVNNSVLDNKSDDSMKAKIRKQHEKRQQCQEQLQVFKLAKSEANMVEVDGVKNNARIFELSDLKRDERFFTTLLGQKSRSSGKRKYIHYIPKKEIEDELQKIEERIQELKNQMSEFNESFEVEVKVNKDLDLI